MQQAHHQSLENLSVPSSAIVVVRRARRGKPPFSAANNPRPGSGHLSKCRGVRNWPFAYVYGAVELLKNTRAVTLGLRKD